MVPSACCITSVVVFIVIPLAAGWLTRALLINRAAGSGSSRAFCRSFDPVTIGALLATLVAHLRVPGGQHRPARWLARAADRRADHHPGLFQFRSGLSADAASCACRHNVAAPGALIGASNFFELAVAVGITLFGADPARRWRRSWACWWKCPVMLSVCGFCNRTRHWFVNWEQ